MAKDLNAVSESRSVTWLRWAWVPDLAATFSRFPLAIVIAALFTLYHMGDVRVVMGLSRELDNSISSGLITGFLWTVAVDFYAESNARSHAWRSLFWLGGTAVILVLFVFGSTLRLSAPLLIAGLFLCVPLASQLRPESTNASLWQFNYRLWEGAVFALIGALLLGAGLSLILESLNFLFGLGLSSDWHRSIWTLSLGFVAPVGWLAFAPSDFETEVRDGEQTDFTARALMLIVRFILVPLLLVYTAILYAYAIKIAVEGVLPSGTLASMVVGYVLTCVVTLLLSYPIRDSGYVLVRFFWRYWLWLCLMPILLLFLAAYQRIEQYGLTEQRVVIVLVGVWIVGLALIQAWQSPRRDLRLVPGLLALLLLAASIGPWGALGLSVRSQKAELADILADRGQLVEGRIVSVPSDAAPPGGMGEQEARIRAIEWYLKEKGALDVLAPWFEGHPAAPFKRGRPVEETEREILVALGVQPDLPPPGRDVFVSHYSAQPEALALGGYSHVIGPLVFEHPPVTARSETVTLQGFGNVRLAYAEGILTVTADNGATIRFDLTEAARQVLTQAPAKTNGKPLRIEGASGGLSGIALIDSLSGTYAPPLIELNTVRLWLALGRGGEPLRP